METHKTYLCLGAQQPSYPSQQTWEHFQPWQDKSWNWPTITSMNGDGARVYLRETSKVQSYTSACWKENSLYYSVYYTLNPDTRQSTFFQTLLHREQNEKFAFIRQGGQTNILCTQEEESRRPSELAIWLGFIIYFIGKKLIVNCATNLILFIILCFALYLNHSFNFTQTEFFFFKCVLQLCEACYRPTFFLFFFLNYSLFCSGSVGTQFDQNKGEVFYKYKLWLVASAHLQLTHFLLAADWPFTILSVCWLLIALIAHCTRPGIIK